VGAEGQSNPAVEAHYKNTLGEMIFDVDGFDFMLFDFISYIYF
jgi:hypothetical protein